MATERRARILAVFRFVLRDVLGGRFLERIRVGQLLEDQHRANGQDGAIAVLAHDAQEIGIRHTVRLVDLALVVARDELLLRRRAGGTGGGDQNRVGPCRDELQDLAGHRCVGAIVFLLGDDLDAGGLGRVAHFGEPPIAVAIGESDEPQRLHAVRLHVHGDRIRHQRIALRRLEHPFRLRIRGIDDPRRSRHRDHRCLGGRRDVHHRQRIRRDRRAHDHIDLVLGDELLRVGDGFCRVGGVVENDPVDLLAADRRREELDRVLLGDAERRRGARRGERNADVDVGSNRPWCGDGECRRHHRQHCSAFHVPSS